MNNEQKIKEEILKLLVEYSGRKVDVMVEKIYRMVTSSEISSILIEISLEKATLLFSTCKEIKKEKTIHKIYQLIHNYFNDIPKSDIWFQTSNQSLDNKTPMQMMKEGEEEKLLKIVESMIGAPIFNSCDAKHSDS